MTLSIYRVVSHTHNHERNTAVIASSKIAASKLVDGAVVHVGEPMAIREGGIVNSSAWNKSYKTPEFSEPSPEWLEHLSSMNLNQGYEDENPSKA